MNSGAQPREQQSQNGGKGGATVNATVKPERDRRHRLPRWALAAVASSPQMTGVPWPVPPTHPVRHQRHAGESGTAGHRSEQASRMSRNRQEQRPGGGAGRRRR
jgi:hypothetical protein